MISIVMPTYKTEWAIVKNAVDSVLIQKYKNWELIIVDDNTIDSQYKREISTHLKEICSINIRLLSNGQNCGANYSRNRGIIESYGKYVAFLDSDDVWDSNYLEVVSGIIDKYSPDIISNRYRVITPYGTYISTEQNKKDGNMYKYLIYEDCIGPTSAVVLKKETAEKVGYFDINLSARQDYDMWIRMSKKGAITCYNSKPVLSINRMGGESISTRGLLVIEGTEKVLEEILRDPDIREEEKKIKYHHYYRCGKVAADRGNYDIGIEYFSKAMKNRFTIKCMVLLLFAHSRWLYRIAMNLNIRAKFYFVKISMKKHM